MNANPHGALLTALPHDLSIFPHQYNAVADQLLLTALPHETRAAASFLDERILTPQTAGAWFSIAQIENAATSLSGAPAGYIFHMGHCGSTLISRLTSLAGRAPGLREPLPLRSFAMDKADGESGLLGRNLRTKRLGLLERLWAREPGAVIKATSICTGLLDEVASSAARVFIFQKPARHLAVLLAGQNALADLRGFAGLRHRRLSDNARIPPLSEFRPGMLAALSWASEAAAAVTAKTSPAAFDFDDFLNAPETQLGKICSALGLQASADYISSAIASPTFRSYSKAPEHAYDGALRARVIADAQARLGDEIKAGLAWLEDSASKNPVIAAAMDAFGG